jgi:hypothetical protein
MNHCFHGRTKADGLKARASKAGLLVGEFIDRCSRGERFCPRCLAWKPREQFHHAARIKSIPCNACFAAKTRNRTEAGKCVRCKNPPRPGLKTCAECEAKRIAKQKTEKP